MHSCGKVNGIIEGLIEIGLDAINLQQPRALGIEEIGKRFRGRDGSAIGVSEDKKRVMLEAFLEYDPWRKR